jgi:hypothetical protein
MESPAHRLKISTSCLKRSESPGFLATLTATCTPVGIESADQTLPTANNQCDIYMERLESTRL